MCAEMIEKFNLEKEDSSIDNEQQKIEDIKMKSLNV
jgi:hypothetical protein